MHLPLLVQDLAVILGVAAIIAFVFQRIRQPVVLGYLVAGLIVGPFTPPFSFIVDIPGVRVWADLGVIFLMFSLGLEFSFRKLLSVGITAAVTGPFEAVCMLLIGFGAGKAVGWSTLDSLFLGAILSISSTTIIIKALEELGIKKEPFAQLIFGILVVEDLVGILLLVAFSTLADEKGVGGLALLWAVLKLTLIVASWILIGSLTVPRLISSVARRSTDETLTLLSLGLCLGMVVFSAYFSYSSALGAFVMGSLIGESSDARRIEDLIRPLRDVFAAVFFVSIGMLINPAEIFRNWRAVLALSLLTVVGKAVSTAVGARLTGRSWRTSLQVGLGLAQIGEFSFIIAGLGITLGPEVMRPELYSIAVAVSVLTTFTTPYLIRVSKRLSETQADIIPTTPLVRLPGASLSTLPGSDAPIESRRSPHPRPKQPA